MYTTNAKPAEVPEKKTKLVCPDCKRDVGESGLGTRYVYCGGHCMRDILKTDCPTVPASDAELELLAKDAY